MYPTIDTENLFCHYDHIKHLPIMMFRNVLTDELIADAHNWLAEVIKQSSTKQSIQGFVYDLQETNRFKSTAIDFQDESLKNLPMALIVKNVYQEKQLRGNGEEEERKWLVSSYHEAFDFIESFNQAHGISQLGEVENDLILNSESASVFYSTDQNTLFVTYYGIVTPVVTADVYATMAEVLAKYGVENVRAGIFDFRHVSRFENANLTTVRRTSSNLNTNYDMSHIAVALVVGSIIQERMVMVSLKITPQEERKRIVHSDAQAQKFIAEFHAKRVSKTG